MHVFGLRCKTLCVHVIRQSLLLKPQDHSKLAFKVSDLENSNKENNRKLNNLTEDVEVQKKNVIQLFKLNDEFRKEMEDLGEQVAELYLLKKSINVSSNPSFNHHCKSNVADYVICCRNNKPFWRTCR